MNTSEFGKVRIFSDHELEKWRAETFFNKEPETIAWIEQMRGEGLVFYDVGANIGVYSLYAASRNAALRVIALEPVLNNYNALRQNIGLNKFSNVESYCIAVSNVCKPDVLYLQDVRVGNSGAQLGREVDDKGISFEAIDRQTVLSLSIEVMVKSLGFPCPTHIKIDVDGLEGKVIDGMKALFSQDGLKSILIEFNSDEEQRDLTNLLSQYGFKGDEELNNMSNHSSSRRKTKGSRAVNVVFNKA